MKNLLFIEGNRQNIDKENVKQSYHKIMSLGYIQSMPIEYLPMDKAIDKIGGRKLFKATVVRNTGEGEPTISNFKIIIEVVKPEDYCKYDGVCEDGQHRDLALKFPGLKDVEPTYAEIEIPENMDTLSYIAIRNNGKNWNNDDFYNSGITTNEKEVDHMLKQCKDYKAAFIFPLYTLGTANLQPKQIKAIQLGYKKASDFKNLQLDNSTHELGDKLLNALTTHSFLTQDRFTGRFAGGLKAFYEENGKDIQKVLDTITLIDKHTWDIHFTAQKGQSMEIKSYAEAFKALYAEFCA
ncbi:MAG: hypothetical protein LUH50_13090 [Bacteroides intestinalis]|nr:hypothetical protein [Bacteroides intestinalis]